MRLFAIFAAVFVAAQLVAGIAATKMIAIGSLFVPAGTLVFPLTFILNDVMTEVYGFARTRTVVWTALACQAFAALTYAATDALPSAPFWHGQAAYHNIVGFAPRIAVASVLAFFVGELANSAVLSRMKSGDGGKRGWRQGWRFVASTVVGEGLDSAIVMAIAFGGMMPASALVTSIASLYAVKVAYEIAALPVSVPFANWVKRVEAVDALDDWKRR